MKKIKNKKICTCDVPEPCFGAHPSCTDMPNTPEKDRCRDCFRCGKDIEVKKFKALLKKEGKILKNRARIIVPVPEKVIVLAGSMAQYEDFLTIVDPPSARKKYIYGHRVEIILGIRAHSVITYGTWYEKPDADKLLELAISRIVT